MSARVLCAIASLACLLSSCAGRPVSEGGTLVSSFAAAPALDAPVRKKGANDPVALTPVAWGRINNPRALLAARLRLRRSPISDFGTRKWC